MLLSFRLGLDLVIYFFKYDIHCICHFKSYVFYCCIAYALLACTTLISPSNLSFDHNNPNIIYLDHLKINWSYHMKELYAFSFNSHRKNLMSWLIPSTKPWAPNDFHIGKMLTIVFNTHRKYEKEINFWINIKCQAEAFAQSKI